MTTLKVSSEDSASFESLYQYETHVDSKDVEVMAREAALTNVNNNVMVKALDISAEDLLPSVKAEFVDRVNLMTILCRHKSSGEVVSGACNYDFQSAPISAHYQNKKVQHLDDFLSVVKKQDAKSIALQYHAPIAMSSFVFASDKHIGFGLGKKQIIMLIHELRQCGYDAFYTQVISDASCNITFNVLCENSIIHTGSMKCSDYVSTDGTRPLAHLPGECRGVLWKTQLKEKYAMWASSQKVVSGGQIRSYSSTCYSSAYKMLKLIRVCK